MIGVSGHDSAGYTGPGTTWAYEKNFVMNHAPEFQQKYEAQSSEPVKM